MLKIALVDDDENKLKSISSHMLSRGDDIKLFVARSYKSARNLLSDGGYDLLLLDMSLPTFDKGLGDLGGRWRKFGGRDLLFGLKTQSKNLPTLVVTQFDTFGEGHEILTLSELDNQLKELFSELYLGAVYYSANENNWKRHIDGEIDSIIGGLK